MINSFSGDFQFLSNFWYVSVVYDGVIYKSTEHAFQAAKTLDVNERKQIESADTPAQAKRLGKRVKMREDWSCIKNDTMLYLLRKKFEYPVLAKKLAATELHELIEGNHWHDNYWGVCSCTICQMYEQHNWLGKLLMTVRSEIK